MYQTMSTMPYKKIILMLLSLSSLAALNSFAQQDGSLELLYGIQLKQQQLIIQVKSNGCTQAEDFRVKTTPTNADKQASLQVLRQQADHCRAMSRVIEIELPLPLDNGQAFTLENQLSTPPAITRS